jgi:hypothetical protein
MYKTVSNYYFILQEEERQMKAIEKILIALVISLILIQVANYINPKKNIVSEELIEKSKIELTNHDNESDAFMYDPSPDANNRTPNLYYTNLPTYNVDKYFLLAIIEVNRNDTNLFGISSDGELDRYEIDRQTKEFLLKSGIHDPESLVLNKKPRKELLRGYIQVYGSKDLNKLYNAYYGLTGTNLK